MNIALSRSTYRQIPFADRSIYGRASSDKRLLLNVQGRNKRAVGPDKYPVFNPRLVLVGPIVITGNGAGPDVDVATDLGVPDVSQMVDVAGFTDRRLLYLDEITDVHRVSQTGPRTQT